ncbi:MAG TPA: virulence RhuM family protein [Tepidisphaeraceae bacterium]|jgi:hypothetical protein
MTDSLPTGPGSEILIYQTEDKQTRVEVRLEQQTVWLSQKQLAELFQKDVRTVNEHIRNVFEEGELQEDSVIRKFRITASDGKTYETLHYNLDVIISVGYRVKSHRGTQFRIWATQRLREYIVKGFALDDKRLMEAGRESYFDELLERIRAIRASERMFYQKITDIYSSSIDYDVNAEITRTFFASVQNKFHYAIHGHTAAELVVERASADKPNMGLTTWKNAPDGPVRKADVTVAKNYLSEAELKQLNLIVDQYLSFAELQAQRRKPMHMADWASKLNDFLTLNDRDILQDAGKVSHELAEQLAHKQFEAFEAKRRAFESQNPVSDFDQAVKRIENKWKGKKK